MLGKVLFFQSFILKALEKLSSIKHHESQKDHQKIHQILAHKKTEVLKGGRKMLIWILPQIVEA